MAYEDIQDTTSVSDYPGILTGVKTRTLFGQLDLAPSGSASFGTVVGVRSMEFALTEAASLRFVIPERVDVAVAPTLRLWIAPCASESTKEVEFSFSYDVATSDTTPVAGTFGVATATSGDIAISGTLGVVEQQDIALTTAVWGASTSGLVVGELSRVAIADGTELAADCAVIAAALVYTIER